MSTAVVSATCCCGSIGRSDLRQCQDHHSIWNGDTKLTSVTRVTKQFFPLPKIAPEILENARIRGAQVDQLFADYVRGTLKVIPAGTRTDARDLLYKLIGWYDRQNFSKVEVQVLLGNTQYGGVVDFIFDEMIVDLKATAKILPNHEIQVAGYYDIAHWMGISPRSMGILHTTQALKEARLIPLKSVDMCIEWATLCDAYRLLERRGALTDVEMDDL